MSPRAPATSRTATPTTSSHGDRDNDKNSNKNEEWKILEATEAMCHHCFDTLLKELHKTLPSSKTSKSSSKLLLRKQSSTIPLEEELDENKPDFTESLPSLAIECPLFVTWDKRKHQHQHHHRRHHNSNNHKQQQQQADHQFFELRGCIGTLTPKPVVTALGEYAVLAALQDRRFAPIDWKEISQLRVGVSLLINYEECEHCHDWTVGLHGIMIRWCVDPKNNNNYNHNRGNEYSATYLPEVAKEQGWNQQVTVKSLIRKAGWHGPVNDKLLRSIQCTRYQSSKYKLTYDDYVAQRGIDPARRLLSSSGEEEEEDEETDHHNAKNERGGSGCCIM